MIINTELMGRMIRLADWTAKNSTLSVVHEAQRIMDDLPKWITDKEPEGWSLWLQKAWPEILP